jgi:hypothetical protein
MTLTNSGRAVLTLSSISASGDFAQTNTCVTSVAGGRTARKSDGNLRLRRELESMGSR